MIVARSGLNLPVLVDDRLGPVELRGPVNPLVTRTGTAGQYRGDVTKKCAAIVLAYDLPSQADFIPGAPLGDVISQTLPPVS